MAKSIVICSDGTGNSSIKGRGTNVFKLYEAIDLNGHRADPNESEQIALYDDGVGTEKLKLLRLLGGAFGYGLSRNVRQLYGQLARCYRDGDRIYFFGFSRGAFTVRTLAGMIVNCGIIRDKSCSDKELHRLTKRAYESYRRGYATWLDQVLRRLMFWKSGETAEDFCRTMTDGRAPIRFIGVWDTVDAVGFPIVGVAQFWNRVIHQFKFSNHELSDDVEKACHALSIDDERRSFHPLLWKQREGDSERIEQVWFAGVHSNVGGGYPKQGMSLVALDWMMKKAEESGLRFLDSPRKSYREHGNSCDKMYDSRAGMAVYYRYAPRPIARISSENGTPSKIHVSAIRRIAMGAEGYSPSQLPDNLQIVTTPANAVAAGEDPASLEMLRKSISAALTSHKTDLAGASRWIVLRQATHVGFWLASLAVVALGVWQSRRSPLPKPEEGVGWLVEKIVSTVVPFGNSIGEAVIRPLFKYPSFGLTFLVVFLAAYFLGLLGRSRLHRTYSTFWRRALPGCVD